MTQIQGLTEGERRIALVVREWGHQSTLYAWTWCKQYLFRRTPDGRLDPREQFFVVKVGKEKDDGDRWKVGGPLIPDLDTACADYPYTVIKLDGSLQNNVISYINQYGPDVLVMGDNLPNPALKLISPSDYVKQSVTVPFVIIRADAVRNARLRLSTHGGLGSAGYGHAASRREGGGDPVETPAVTGRRIAIAYPTFPVGRGLMQVARDKLLTPQDTVFVCHTYSKDNAMTTIMRGGGKIVRAMTMMDSRPAEPAVTEDAALQFGAKELEGFNAHVGVTLRGDPKNALPAFCEREAIDLLIVGSRSGGLGNRIRKTLAGGSVSSPLIDNCPCPCLVIPHRYLGLASSADSLEDELLSPTASVYVGSPFGGATSLSLPLPETAPSPTTVEPVAGSIAAPSTGPGAHSTPSDLLAVLQAQLEEKDRVIAELREQVRQLRLAQAQQSALSAQNPQAQLSL